MNASKEKVIGKLKKVLALVSAEDSTVDLGRLEELLDKVFSGECDVKENKPKEPTYSTGPYHPRGDPYDKDIHGMMGGGNLP